MSIGAQRIDGRAGEVAWRVRTWSAAVPVRSLVVGAVLVAVVGCVVGLSLCAGDRWYDPSEVFAALSGEGRRATVLVVREFRLPRTIAGLVAGAGFGVAGCLTQVMARNRLATPDLLGVDQGALVVLLVLVSGGAVSTVGTFVAGPVGAVLAAVVLVALAGGIGSAGHRVIVMGIGLSAALGAVSGLVLARLPLSDATTLYRWTVGSLNGRDHEHVLPALVGLVVVIPLAALSSRTLAVLRFGDDVASALGVHLPARRATTLATAVVAAGLAVGVGGPIAFVALAAPIVVARLTDPQRVPVVLSALAGAGLVATSDLVGRLVGGSEGVPVGVVTATLGGPLLLWLVLRGPGSEVPS